MRKGIIGMAMAMLIAAMACSDNGALEKAYEERDAALAEKERFEVHLVQALQDRDAARAKLADEEAASQAKVKELELWLDRVATIVDWVSADLRMKNAQTIAQKNTAQEDRDRAGEDLTPHILSALSRGNFARCVYDTARQKPCR